MKLIAPRPNTSRCHAGARFLTVGLAFLIVAALPLAAQETTPTEAAQGEAAEPTGPAAIPATAVLPRGTETDTLLQRVAEVVTPDPEIVTLAAALVDERGKLETLTSELDRLRERTVSVRTLTDQRERWQRAEVRLQAWMATLQGRWQRLIELRVEVQFESETWALTYASLAESGLGPEVLAAMEDLIVRTDSALAALGPRIDATSELMNRVTRRLDSVNEAFARLDELRIEIRERMFRRDAPPLWRTPVTGPSTVLGEIRAGGDYWWRTAVDWSGGHSGQLILLGLVFGAYLTLAVAARRWRRSWPDESRFEVAAFVVSRPVSIAALGALAVGVFILDPITGPVQDMLRLVAVVAVVRLGQGLSAPLPRLTFRGLVALYVAATFYGFVPDGALLGRLLALLIAGGGAFVAYRSFQSWPRDTSWLWRVARGGTLLAAAVFVLGGAADVLGWVDLGSTLVAGTISSALGAVAWMILIRAIAGLLPLMQTELVGADITGARERQRQFAHALLVPLMIAAAYGWGQGALRNFRLLEQVQGALQALMAWSLAVGGLEIRLGGVLGAIAILIGTIFFARIVRFILSDEIFPRLQMRPGTVSTLVSLINYIIITIGVVMGATAAGFNATQLTVVLGAMSVGIGFGLQAVVGNFVSGLILMFERPVSVGDQVEAAGYLGKITHIGIRASRLHTFDGSDVIIPNSDLVTRQVVNWTLKDGLKRINLDLSVGLDSEPRVVMEILEAVANENELVLDEPAARALMLGYGESSINFRLQVWLRVENAIAVPSGLHLMLIDRLRAAGVEVPAVRRERHEKGATE